MNLLSITDLDEQQIESLFALAGSLKNSGETPLKGRTFVLFFPETSIRTRVTFEMAVKQLGGEAVLFPPSSLDKREEIKDVAGYLENWCDGIIVRHPDFNLMQKLGSCCSLPVINGMSRDNHPCEILSDLYTLRERKENYRDLNYLFVGAEGNIYNSWKNAASVLNLTLKGICPPDNLEAALREADVVLTDPLPEKHRNQEYYKNYQITLKRMKKAKPGALLNPCPPFYRGEEVSEDVIDSSFFAGYGFKKNLLTLQKAVLLYCVNTP
ncbi:MAG: hypothetical protein PQJ58_11480 [Spirochaetales bacterium]|nr:hypothetical protein [Spirochaetales bacterium]